MTVAKKMISVLFFCKMPPPYTGLTIITKTNLELAKTFSKVSLINYSPNTGKGSGLKDKIQYYFTATPKMINCFFQLKKQSRKRDTDIFYFTGSSTFAGNLRDWVIVKIVRKHFRKVICHLHNGDYVNNYVKPRLFNAPQYLSKNIDVFVFSSKGLGQALEQYIEPGRITSMFNPIDDGVVFTDAEIKEKIANRANRGDFVITYLSNFIPSKGYMELLYAAEQCFARGVKNFKIRLIGNWLSSEDKERFFSFLENTPIKEAIEYIGPVRDRAIIKDNLFQSDIFCLPTYYPVEAQPVSIIEAMNAGNAIISTYHASIPEYVTSGKEGLLVEKKNIEQLSDAIERLCNRGVWIPMAEAARMKFNKDFHKAKITDDLQKLFSLN